MNGKERVKALLQGTEIDRTPICGWYHMPLVDRNVEDFVRELIVSTDVNHWDFIKIMTNGHYYTEAFGGEICFSTDNTKWYGEIERYPIVTAEDAAGLPVLGRNNPVFLREVEILKRLKEHYKDEIPILATIFSPLTAVQECAGCLDPGPVKKMMRENPEALHKALEAAVLSNMNFLDMLFEEGVDGIFLANQYSMEHILTDEQYEEFCIPYEKRVVEYCKEKTWFNMAHIHGNRNLRMEPYYAYGDDEIQALNWENCPKDVPQKEIRSIREVKARTQKIIISGIDQMNDTVSEKNDRAAVKDLIVRRFKAAAEEVGSNRFIFGPGCALPTGGSYLNHIIYETVEEYGRTKH